MARQYPLKNWWDIGIIAHIDAGKPLFQNGILLYRSFP